MGKARKNKFYAVRKGREGPRIYSSWEAAKENVRQAVRRRRYRLSLARRSTSTQERCRRASQPSVKRRSG
ncbi:uncharacterized protein B0H18DRAFT_655999 [Fomitopsis serialis]|uniref:uncharacterized protein n=1 Tax=Fomitopsis serialis TaxID=139415 RepID=UPI0020080A2C|nr:uncharacterized protein B0H18DRAFT_655999 [Neoantrodia serialis]KAH9919131.1 hypothetical protein B0H18DRAFT_655999 [Neoantrodia serialis]